MDIVVKVASSQADLETIFSIRQKVFVEEQEVRAEDEFDEFENRSTHFLAYCDGTPSGTARWLSTEKGIKLERFAVLPEFRNNGVGIKLVEAVLHDLKIKGLDEQNIYLHAQLTAIPLYKHFNFKIQGEEFEECGIKHRLMSLN